MKTKCFCGVNAYIDGKIRKTSILFADRILSVGDFCDKDLSAEVERIFLPGGAIVLPGFIDEHIHGAVGADVMDGDEAGLGRMGRAVAGEGTVAFLATTVTASEEKTLGSLEAVNRYLSSDEAAFGAEICGVHLEGPFLSEEYAGAMNKNYLRSPDEKLLKKLVEKARGRVKIVTYAPEKDDGDEFLKTLSSLGIVPSVGHSAATFERVKRAVALGLKNVTHTYNAQSPLRHREAGCVGAALLSDELNCEIIADTVHVSVPALKLLVKNKPKDRVVLVTDSMRAKGAGDGISEIGGQKVIVKGDEARLENGTLAGSILKMNVAVRNMIEKVGVPFADAVNFATINPARALGLDGELGSISVGKRACFAVVDEKIDVLATVRDGNAIYGEF